MIGTTFIMFLSMFIVLIAAILFVNAIEYIGCRLRLGGSFVGSIVAPLFTSIPELIIFIVAIFLSEAARGEDIGVGTLFGQPFMASSLSYGLVGIAALVGYHLKKRDGLVLEVDKALVVPYAFITFLFPLTLLPAIVGFHRVFGALFLLSYFIYVYIMYRKGMSESIEDVDNPYICKIVSEPMLGSIVQLLVAVILLYLGSHELVESVDTLARQIGVSALGLALIIIPAATAIPETASALIWGYRGRDTLCIASLVGEKILYSTFYPSLGLFITSWMLDVHAYVSVIATTIISIILLLFIYKQKIPWWGLCLGLFFFVGYTIAVFVYHF